MNLTQRYRNQRYTVKEIIVDAIRMTRSPEQFGYTITALFDNRQHTTSIHLDDPYNTDYICNVCMLLEKKITRDHLEYTHQEDYVDMHSFVKMFQEAFLQNQFTFSTRSLY